jgi:hypothetical protein
MMRVVLWVLGGLLAVLGIVGIVELVMAGSCGCSDPNYACVAAPCPSSDVTWFVCLFVGAFGAPIVLTISGFMGRSRRVRRYQMAQGPVSADLSPSPLQTPNIISPVSMAAPGLQGGASWNPAVPAADSESDRIQELAKLNDLRQSGAITESEFNTEKARILGGT